MTVEVDARGLSCPGPVIKAREAVASGADAITIIVDSTVARENVCRFFESQGLTVAVATAGGTFTISANK